MSGTTDRPLYEDLLKQRNDLEQLTNRMIEFLRDSDGLSALADNFQAQLDAIIDENRRREGLT